MNGILYYLLMSGISLVAFYLLYLLFLQNQSNFTLSRFFLLSVACLSFIIPSIHLEVTQKPDGILSQIWMQTVTIADKPLGNEHQLGLSLATLVQAIYLAGLAFFLSRFAVRMGQILLIALRHGIQKTENGYFVMMDIEASPFSFWKLIYLPKNIRDSFTLEKIIDHEKAHIKLFHTLDIVMIELISSIQWFNPVVWLFKRSLQGIHEYQADREVINKGTDLGVYQQILFSQSTGIPYNSIVNSFNQSLFKKRLIMMKKEKPKKFVHIRLLVALPIVLFVLIATMNQCHTFSKMNKEPQARVSQNNGDDLVYTVVEEMPVFSQGGNEGLMNYIASNVKYPDKSRKAGVQGKVFVGFVVDENGNVTNVEEKRTTAEKPNKKGKMKSCDAPELTAEAIRVISSLPKFTAGKQRGKNVKVAYTIPIRFRLDNSKK